MSKKSDIILNKIIRLSFYIFVFLLPWQIKYIIEPAATNFNEISLYASHIFLFITVLSFLVYKLKKYRRNQNVSLLWVFISGLSLFIFISFFFAPNKDLAYYRFIVYLFSLGLFFLLREETRLGAYEKSIISKSKTIIVFLSSIFFQATLAIYQFLSQSSFAFKYLGLAKHSPDVLGTSVIESSSGRWLRAYGGFDHPNILGGVLAFSLILGLYLLAKKRIINSKNELIQSIFLFVFYFTGLLALIFSFSRSAWLAFLVSVIVLFIVFLIKKNFSAFKRLLILSFFSLILVSVIFVPFRDLFTGRLQATGRLEERSITERHDQVYESLDLLQQNWLFGVGLGNYTERLKVNDEIKKSYWQYQPVHNSFLLLLSETGIISLLFFLAILFTLSRDKRKAEYFWPVLFQLLVLLTFDHWLISLPFGILFLFFVLGLI
jgi:O-antigen ligase